MKTNIFAFTLFLSLSQFAQAQFAGSDDFSGGGKDAAKWGADINEGGSSFSQTGDGVVRYVSTSEDTSSTGWPWAVGFAPVSNSWSAQLDVNVPFVDLPVGNSAVGIGLVVFNDTDTDESMSISLEQVRSGGVQSQNFMSAFVGNGGGTPEISTSAAASTAAVRINWDATSHMLSAEYDADGASGGYSWTPLRTFDPTLGSSWNAPTDGVFRVALLGSSEQIEIATTNEVSADNFVATLTGGSGSQPILSASQTGGQITLSWSATATGYALESKADLTPGSWNPVLDVPVNNGGTLSVTLTIGGGSQFFRLKKP